MTTLGTTLGGGAAAKKKNNKKKGGAKPQAGETALGAPPAENGGGSALGGPAQSTSGGTALGGTALGAPAQAAGGGTALGPAQPTVGGTALGGTALGAPAQAAGTALGGTALGGGGAAKKNKKKGKKPAVAATPEAATPATTAPPSGEPAPTSSEGTAGAPSQGEKPTLAESTPAAQGGSALGGTALGGAPAGAAAKKKNKKKKGPAKPAPAAATETPAAGDSDLGEGKGRKDVKGRKGGISKAMAARILQQKEEQRLREEEEKRREEEEARLEQERLEEEKRKEEEKKLIKIQRKAEKKKRQEEQARLEKERKKQEHLARYGIKVAPKAETASEAAAAAKKKKSQSEMYKNLSKGKGKGKGQGTTSPEAVSPQQGRKEDSHAEEDVEDSWEAHADEDVPSAESGKEKEKEADSPEETKAEEEEVPEQKRRELRSPICCILGHVDVGKTKLLDKIRHTNVQGGEAGGITQQIGATYFPLETLQEKTKQLLEGTKFTIRVPGLLIIDTPGHESFTNLRSRGSSLCDIAILVVDLMHGLEQQTLESLNLLKMKKTPFIVALNKVDRVFSWKPTPDGPFVQSLKKQTKSVVQEFETRTREVITQFAEQEMNAVLYYKNEDFSKYVSLVPTSAHTGEGIPDLLALLVKLTQTKMTAKITTLSTFQATVLEVKIVEGLGTTIDVILSNGVLHEGDKIVICGLDGPIVTSIRALLTPHPLRELRVKTPYLHHKEVKAAQGIKIAAHGLEKAVAGSSLFVLGPGDSEEELKKQVQGELTDMLSKVSKRGVAVQASTLGSLEALLTFLEASKIPVGAINLGPVYRSDVMKAAVNLGEKNRKKEYGTILAFDVKVTKDARDEAVKTGVKIFTADIIYHLFDQFTAYVDQIKEEERQIAMAKAIFPVSLEIMPDCIFNQKEPILVGVRVKAGVLKVGTPLCVCKANEEENATGKKKIIRFIGKVTGIEDNRKPVTEAHVDQEVAVKIEGGGVLYGRHFDYNDELFSQLTRESIDVLKEHFRDLLRDKEIIGLIKTQKEVLGIL